MDYITILGLVAASLSTLAFIPQVIKTWQTKSAKDLSFAMFFLMFTATALWLIYGLLMSALPIIVANATVLVLLAIILYFKLTYK
jgi:MtN3 and saliva related transmembrane protein